MRLVCALVVACAIASCGVRGKRLDTTALVAELGLDGAAQVLRVRIADDPADVGARRALARLETERGRPGAVMEQLEIVDAIGGPLGSRLDDGERAQLRELYRQRGEARAARGSPDAYADLERAGALDADAGRLAVEALAVAELKDTDPDRRARGEARLATLAGHADDGDTGRWLWERGAKRAAHERLDAWERDATDRDPATLDAWMQARAWWGGAGDRPDLATLRRAIAAGASPCTFALDEGEHGCEGDLTRARARGWRTRDADRAATWVAVTARAWFDGATASWLDELDARVELTAVVVNDLPVWARGTLLRALGRDDEAQQALTRARASAAQFSPDARRVIALELVLAGGSAADVAALDADVAARMQDAAEGDAPAIDEVLAASLHAGDGLAEVARAFLHDPASADRVAADVAARDVDVAHAGAQVAELFTLLGDPARARAWWERAVDASPLDPALRAGLVRGLAAAGDGAAARIAVVTAAARSGDAGRAMLDGARAMADAGLTVDALVPAKDALELTAPGEQQEVLALLIELATRMDRRAQVETLTAALAAQQTPRGATGLHVTADPFDADRALADGSLAALTYAARWNPRHVGLRAAILALAPDDAAARSELAALAAAGDRDAARALLSASRAGASSR